MRIGKWGAAALGGLLVGLIGGVMRRRLTRFEIAEDSMAPVLRAGDFVLTARSRAIPGRGDLVVFPHPHRSDFDLVKRVVGLPGERVDIANAQVHIDGSVLAEPWADGPTLPDGSWELGDEELFLLGDNRAASIDDSRHLGPFPLEGIPWRVVFRYWPLYRVGRL
ncbi:MAG: signal peptidase I [Acidimicrobiia bacterium]